MRQTRGARSCWLGGPGGTSRTAVVCTRGRYIRYLTFGSSEGLSARARWSGQRALTPAQGNGNGGSGDGPTWDDFWKIIRGELKLSNTDAAKKLGRPDFKGLDAVGRQAVIDQLRAMAAEGKVA